MKEGLGASFRDQTVTESVLLTVLIEVEGMLNSKPLGYVSSDIAHVDPVTPKLLLVGRLDTPLAQELLGRRQWRQSQVIADHFWSRFIKQYLPSLQSRQKWQDNSPDLKIYQVVKIVYPQSPRAQWPVGRVLKTFTGPDNITRVAKVHSDTREYIRPVTRLIQLRHVMIDQ